MLWFGSLDFFCFNFFAVFFASYRLQIFVDSLNHLWTFKPLKHLLFREVLMDIEMDDGGAQSQGDSSED